MTGGTRAQILAWAWTYGAFPLAWLSVFLHARTPWRRTELGRHLMIYAILIATILTFATVRHFTQAGFPQWVEWVRFAVYLSFPPVMAWRVAIQIRARRRPKTLTPAQ